MNSLDKTDQVIINLKVISMLTEGQRLCWRNNNFSVYPAGWSQAVYRWMFGESRWVNMEEVKTVVNDAIRILGTYINMVQHAYTPGVTDRYTFAVPTPQTSLGFVLTMARELETACRGLLALKATYAGDQLITATFELLIERTSLEIEKASEVIRAFTARDTPTPPVAAPAPTPTRSEAPTTRIEQEPSTSAAGGGGGGLVSSTLLSVGTFSPRLHFNASQRPSPAARAGAVERSSLVSRAYDDIDSDDDTNGNGEGESEDEGDDEDPNVS
jgi:hypothetical protein